MSLSLFDGFLTTPDMIADAMVAALRVRQNFRPVEADGAARAARMLADLI